MALEGLCECYADLVEAREVLRSRGAMTYECVTESGAVMYRPYPEVAIISDADRRFGFWLGKVGMTPADRSKVSAVLDREPQSPWQNLKAQ